MADAIIRAALESHLVAMADLPEARKFEGQPFAAPGNQPWLKVGLAPGAATVVAFGAGGIVRRQGAFAIELNEPVDGGRGLAHIERLADALAAHFRPGAALSRDGLVVRIARTQRGAVAETANRLSLTVSAEYFCDCPNS